MGFFFLTHDHSPERLTLGVNLSGGMGDHIQFYAIVQLLLGGLRGFFQRLQRAQPNVARAILYLDKTFTEFFRFNQGSLLYLRDVIILKESIFKKLRRRDVPPPRRYWGKA